MTLSDGWQVLSRLIVYPPSAEMKLRAVTTGSVSLSAQVRYVRIQQLNLVSVYTHTELTWVNSRRAKIKAKPAPGGTCLICGVSAGRAIVSY